MICTRQMWPHELYKYRIQIIIMYASLHRTGITHVYMSNSIEINCLTAWFVKYVLNVHMHYTQNTISVLHLKKSLLIYDLQSND